MPPSPPPNRWPHSKTPCGGRRQATRWLLGLVSMLLVLPAAAQSDPHTLLQPHFERSVLGWIDWDNGMIYGVGRAYIAHNDNSKARTRGAAHVVASGNIVKLAAGLRLDDRRTLEALGGGRVVIQLRAFLRVMEQEVNTMEEVPQPYVEVILKSPIAGIEGLTAKLLSHLHQSPGEWQEFPATTAGPPRDDTGEPWLVLDARRLALRGGIQPALFPKILTPSGETVYELKAVDQGALVERGMARYVRSSASRGALLGRSDLENLPPGIAALLLPETAEAAAPEPFDWEEREPREKKKKRGPLIIKDVKQASGLLQTNLVISEEDARQLKAEDASSQILKKCRVIVIVSSPIGGVEGGLPVPLILADHS